MNFNNQSQNRLYLFAQPSFTTGTARLIDFFRIINTYNTSASSEEADFQGLLADWLAVGDDLENAMNRFNIVVDDQE